jgi:cytidylate kinase
MMTGITISRQLGSFGDEVGQAIAKRMNFKLVCRRVINQAALNAQVPEVALATIDDLGLLGIRPSQKDQQAYHRAVRHVMEELADRGEVVIIGRAGQVILKARPDVMHVKVIAPAKLRAQRIAEEHKISLKSAQERIKASDRSREKYLRRFYRVRWDDPELYDLIVNTGRLDPDQAACVIFQGFSGCVQGTNLDNQTQ